MASFKLRDKGQALTETILVIPLLVLLLAGILQLTLLFQARTTFDKVCGDLAREYAAGTINDPAAFSEALWSRLGSYQKYFSKSSLNVNTQAPQPTLTDNILQKIDSLGPLFTKIRSFIINYGGQTWKISIDCAPPFLPSLIFPNGINFQTQVTILRYPA